MKNFFKGISFSSICAGALAAVTSFLLSAKIGIAGSVIGVAAGSVVSAVATQVYKNVLKASGEKIQQAVPFPSSSETVSNERAADETQVLGSSEQDDETRIIGSSPVASDVTMVLSADTAAVAQSGLPRVISSGQEYADATRALGDIAGAGETSVFPNGQRGVSDVGVVTGKTGTLGSAHDARVQHAGQRSSNWSAGLILAFTGGQGTDTVVRDVVHEKVVPSHGNTDDYQTGGGQTPVQKPKSDSTDSNDETTTEGSDKTTNGSTDSSTSNGTSSNTNGSTSGNSGSSSDNSSNGSSQNGTDSSNGTGSNGGTSGTTGDGSSSGSGNSGTDGSTGTGTSGSTDGTTGSTGDASSN